MYHQIALVEIRRESGLYEWLEFITHLDFFRLWVHKFSQLWGPRSTAFYV